ncbi:MAG: IclR family transcriptional regulator [Halapricum sp.]
MDDDNGQKKIKSIERMFDIVEYISEQPPAGVTELSQELGISKGNVHAYLCTLEKLGYIVNMDGNYRLGLEYLRHGIKARNTYERYPLINQKVTHLAEETGERVWAQVEENGMAYYLCGAKGEHPIQPPVQVGERVPIHQIAAGKAILSCMEEERIEEIIDRHGLPAATENTITDPAELFEELDRIRKRGYALNREESLEGLHAVGAPIQSQGEDVYGALSISGPANRLTESRIESEFSELLLGAVNELEINLTYG